MSNVTPLALKFQVLGFVADRRKRKNAAIVADGCNALYGDLGQQFNAVTKHDFRSNMTKRTDANTGPKGAAGFDHG